MNSNLLHWETKPAYQFVVQLSTCIELFLCAIQCEQMCRKSTSKTVGVNMLLTC
jgi:hypothetical protein